MDTDLPTTSRRIGTAFNAACRDCGTYIEFDMPGWSLDAFTRTGRLGLWSIIRMFEVVRVLTSTRYSHIYSNRIENEDGSVSLALVSGQTGRFARALHTSASLVYPMYGRVGVGHVGKSSFTVVVELYSRNSDQLIGIIERLIVYKNLTTNSPVSVPESVRGSRHIMRGRTKLRLDLARKDEVTVTPYKCIIKVCASDLDIVYHANQAVYFRYCMDAAYEAGKHGALVNFPHDICEYSAEYAQGRHVGECFAGDWINVHVWEDPKNKLTLHFDIRRGDVCVFLAYVTFYSIMEARL